MISHSSHRQEFIKKRRKERLTILGLFALGLSLVFILLIYVAYRPALRISAIEPSGQTILDKTEVEKEVFSYLSRTYFWIFPKDNGLIYPKGSLEKYLREKFKRIETLDLNLKGFKTLQIKVNDKGLLALWCEGQSEQCYFLDEKGMVFAKSPNFSGDAYFRYYGLINEEPIGKYYLSSTTQFAQMHEMVNRGKDLSIHPIYMNVNANNEFTLFLRGGGKIYFDLREPLIKTSDNLASLLRAANFKPDSNGNLPIDYIDLRFGNKLFYKLRTQ